MEPGEKIYRRLPGRAGKNFGLVNPGRYRLWQGPDHLLQVCTTYFSENYKRFYLKDIQAFVVVKTGSGKVLNSLLGLAVFLAVLASLLSLYPGAPFPFSVFAVFAGMFSLGLLANTLLGPTCVCRLHTAVQAEELVSLSRLRTARRTIDLLKPLIEGVQGRLGAEDLSSATHRLTGTGRPGGGAVVHSLPAAVRHEDGKLHAALFALLLVVAANGVIDIFYQHPIKNILGMMLSIPLVLLLVIALRKQHESDLPYGIRIITWVVLGVWVTNVLFGMVYVTVYQAQHPEFAGVFSPLSIRFEGPVFVSYCAVSGIVDATLGLLGLFRLKRFRSAYVTSQTSSPDRQESQDE